MVLTVLRKFYNVYNRTRAAAIITLLSGIILLCIVQVVLRYFTSSALKPFAWGDEIVRLSSIWVSFLGASIGVRDSSHLSVSFFLEKYIPPRALNVVRRAATVIVLVVLTLLVVYGVKRTISNIPTMLQNVPMSMAWFYAAIPVGSLFLWFDYFLIVLYGKHPFSRVKGNGEAAADAGGTTAPNDIKEEGKQND